MRFLLGFESTGLPDVRIIDFEAMNLNANTEGDNPQQIIFIHPMTILECIAI